MVIRRRLYDQRSGTHRKWEQKVIAHGDWTKEQLRQLEAETIKRFVSSGINVVNALHAGQKTQGMVDRNPVPKRTQYTIGEMTGPMGFWLQKYKAGVSMELALARINRLGWEPERAFSTPPA